MSKLAQPPGELLPAGGWGHGGVVAIRKAKVPGWTPFEVRAVGDDRLYRGGVEGAHKNGKRKWTKPYSSVVVTAAEVAEQLARYEVEHGRCGACHGSGRMWTGWSSRDGHSYAPCSTCGATGLPPHLLSAGPEVAQ